MQRKPRMVNCPQCGKTAPWDKSNPYRPVCSERCKMIYLGAWASESYRVPVVDDKEEPETGGHGEER